VLGPFLLTALTRLGARFRNHRGLQAGSLLPFVHIGADFELPGSAQGFLSQRAGRKQAGFLSQFLSLVCKTFFERSWLFETTPIVHGAAPFPEKAESQLALSPSI
jgi:hypothetical protein